MNNGHLSNRHNDMNAEFAEEVRNLKLQLEEKNEEIIGLRQREISNEDYRIVL